MSSSGETKWLWKFTSTEAFYECFTVTYRFVLATSRPLLEEHFALALRHLFRKVPSLRVCLGEKDGEKWLKEMAHESIDLKMLSGGETSKLFQNLLEYKFNMSRGPLWCVRIKPGDMECGPEYKHVYDLFWVISHAISDGTSNVKICGLLMTLLDQVLSGTLVDDSEQLDDFVSDQRKQMLIQKNLALFEGDSQLRSHAKTEFEATVSTASLYKKAFKEQENVAETEMIWKDFETDAMSSLLQRCRIEDVTFNSAFTAVANIAMVELLAEEGLLQESYILRSDHVFNARRYWAESTSKYLGCHVLPFAPIVVETPRNARENIWIYAKTVNEKLQTKINTVLKDEALKRCMPGMMPYTFEFEFGLTNMGDITPMLEEERREIRVLHLLRSSIIHNMPSPFGLFLNTFRGSFTCNMIYNSSLVTSEIAQKYIGLIFKYLHAAIRE